jgi:hypothetical protein
VWSLRCRRLPETSARDPFPLARDTARAMSQENLDLLRRAFEYVERTGEILPEAVHPDIVLDNTTFRGAIIPGTFVGIEEVNEWLAEWNRGPRRLVVRYRGGLSTPGIRWSQSSASVGRLSTAARRWRSLRSGRDVSGRPHRANGDVRRPKRSPRSRRATFGVGDVAGEPRGRQSSTLRLDPRPLAN